MIKLLVLLCLATSSLAHAVTPWARDCVTFWGADIPVNERTQDNCPRGSNHWDQGPKDGTLMSVNSQGGNTLPQTVLLPSGNYVIIRNATTGAPQAILPVSRK